MAATEQIEDITAAPNLAARGERTCRVCGKVERNCTHCAGTVCEVCHWEEVDLCDECAEKNHQSQIANVERSDGA